MASSSSRRPEFLDRLADLVPPPRKHRHRYHGVFAPNHKLRRAVTALAPWLEANIPEALTVFAFPAAHQRRLRTNNGLERLNKEIKRRTRVATLFPNDASLLRLVSAVLSEISDDWETQRSYLNIKAT